LKGDPHGEATPPTKDRQQETQSSSRSPQAISDPTDGRPAALAWRLSRSPLTFAGTALKKSVPAFFSRPREHVACFAKASPQSLRVVADCGFRQNLQFKNGIMFDLKLNAPVRAAIRDDASDCEK
jgi:hypothetical protein